MSNSVLFSTLLERNIILMFFFRFRYIISKYLLFVISSRCHATRSRHIPKQLTHSIQFHACVRVCVTSILEAKQLLGSLSFLSRIILQAKSFIAIATRKKINFQNEFFQVGYTLFGCLPHSGTQHRK